MVQIIGHRGAPALVPENTIESFRKAIEAGADFLECDVHLSRDGKLVVMHDDRLDRTTNGKGVVRDLPLEEIKRLTISGSLKIPTIEEVLALDFPLIIELKSYQEGESHRTYDGLVARLLQTLREHKPDQEIILESNNNEYLNLLRQTPFKRLKLMPGFSGFDSLRSLDVFAFGVLYNNLTAELVNEAHKRNLKVLSWPPDRKEDIERSILMGLDLLLSDNPGHALEIARELDQRQ